MIGVKRPPDDKPAVLSTRYRGKTEQERAIDKFLKHVGAGQDPIEYKFNFTAYSKKPLKPALEKLFHGKAGQPERIATGKFSQSFFIRADAGEFVLRIAPPEDTPVLFYEQRMMRREPGIHALVLKHTDMPAAEIVAKIDADSKHHLTIIR